MVLLYYNYQCLYSCVFVVVVLEVNLEDLYVQSHVYENMFVNCRKQICICICIYNCISICIRNTITENMKSEQIVRLCTQRDKRFMFKQRKCKVNIMSVKLFYVSCVGKKGSPTF